MPWLRLDESFAEHEKILGLSHPAFRLHVTGLLSCARNLTDGFISDTRLVAVCAVSGTTRKHVAELEHSRLWLRVNGGWQVNDYLDYNPSADKVREERAQARERQRRWKEKRNNGVSDTVGDGVNNAAPYRTVPFHNSLSVVDKDPSFLPSPTQDGKEGRDFDFESVLGDVA